MERAEDERDQYGRLLAYVWRERDDVLVNKLLVLRGFATVLVVSPNRARFEEFAQAEAKAREKRRGLWGACDTALSDGG